MLLVANKGLDLLGITCGWGPVGVLLEGLSTSVVFTRYWLHCYWSDVMCCLSYTVHRLGSVSPSLTFRCQASFLATWTFTSLSNCYYLSSVLTQFIKCREHNSSVLKYLQPWCDEIDESSTLLQCLVVISLYPLSRKVRLRLLFTSHTLRLHCTW